MEELKGKKQAAFEIENQGIGAPTGKLDVPQGLSVLAGR